MKKILYLLLCMMPLGFVSCESEDEKGDVVPSSLEIAASSLDFDAAGGDGFIDMHAYSQKVTAESSAEWCEITEVTDTKVTFKVAVNEDIESRLATITVATPQEERHISVLQSGVVCTYDTNLEYMYDENAAFEEEIAFSSTLPVVVTIPDEAKSWLSYVAVEGGYKFTGKANNTGSLFRTANVTISSGEKSVVYSFTQYSLSNVTFDDLMGNWNVSYSDGSGSSYTSQAQIGYSTSKVALLVIDLVDVGRLGFEVNFENGALKIPMGQPVGTLTNGWFLYNYPTADGNPIHQNLDYVGKLKMTSSGGLQIVFGEDWASQGLLGMGLFMYTSEQPSDANCEGGFTYILNLKLSK